MLTQGLLRRELGWKALGRCLSEGAQIIGGVMLILGMALALTNYLVDAGIPDQAVDWVQQAIPNKYVFLLLLCVFLFFAAALMEIYAAIVVLVPLLLPLGARLWHRPGALSASCSSPRWRRGSSARRPA